MNDIMEFFSEIEKHLMEDRKPSEFLERSKGRHEMKILPFIWLKRLEDVEQSPLHHPEGNVWVHTMMVVDQAALRRDSTQNPRVFMWAALLHDIGKAVTTKVRKGRITSYDHDKEGAKLAVEFLKTCGQEEGFIRDVSALVRWHMQAFVLKDLPFADVEKMKSEVSIEEVGLLALCDRLGRGTDTDPAEEEERIRLFIEKCRKA